MHHVWPSLWSFGELVCKTHVTYKVSHVKMSQALINGEREREREREISLLQQWRKFGQNLYMIYGWF